MKTVNMITAEEARKNVLGHSSCAVVHLDSEDKDINAEYIYEVTDPAIRQASADGLSNVTIIVDSAKPFEKVLDIPKIISFFKTRGYIAVFRRELEDISEGVVRKYVLSVEIVW